MAQVSSDMTRVFRISIPDAVNAFNIPVGITHIVIKNVGANDMRFNFDDDGPNDYYTLEPKEVSPPMKVKGGKTNVNTDGVNGATTVEILAWG